MNKPPITPMFIISYPEDERLDAITPQSAIVPEHEIFDFDYATFEYAEVADAV